MLPKKNNVWKLMLILAVTSLTTSCATLEKASSNSEPLVLTKINNCPQWVDPILPEDEVLAALNEAIKTTSDGKTKKILQSFKVRLLNHDEDYLHNCFTSSGLPVH